MTRREEDLRWIRQAKRRIFSTLSLTAVLMVLFGGLWSYVLMEWLNPLPPYGMVLTICTWMVESVVWIIVFYQLYHRASFSRMLFWICFGIQVFYTLVLLFGIFSQTAYFAFFIGMIAGQAILLAALAMLGRWLKDSFWASIHFERRLLLPEDEKEEPKRSARAENQSRSSRQRESYSERTQVFEPVHPAQVTPGSVQSKPADSREPDFQSEKARPNKAVMEVPRRKQPVQLAIRLAVCVYAELIIFPMAVHFLQDQFVSLDNSRVFALNLMFTLCILSAVLWTIPVFFLYLKEKGAGMAVKLCALLQLMLAAGGWYHLYTIYQSGAYNIRAFILFLVLDLVRLLVLYCFVIPAARVDTSLLNRSALQDEDDDDEDQSGESDPDLTR